MQAKDVMARKVVAVHPDAPLAEAARLMLDIGISGLPVIDDGGRLVGIVSEGDLLRRVELGTEPRRPRWLAWLTSSGRLAGDYARSHGRRVREVMTDDVVTVGEETPLDEIVRLMTEARVKRLPVLRDGTVVGMVSRADLMRALAGRLAELPGPVSADDAAIRAAILDGLDGQPWAPVALLNVVVTGGRVALWGTLLDERERDAVRALIEAIPGVTGIEDHLISIEPMSGSVVRSPDEEAREAAAERRLAS